MSLRNGGSPWTTWVNWSNTLFHFGYGNFPVATSTCNITEASDEIRMFPHQGILWHQNTIKLWPQTRHLFRNLSLTSVMPRLHTSDRTSYPRLEARGSILSGWKEPSKVVWDRQTDLHILFCKSRNLKSHCNLLPCKAGNPHLWFLLCCLPVVRWCQSHTVLCFQICPAKYWRVWRLKLKLKLEQSRFVFRIYTWFWLNGFMPHCSAFWSGTEREQNNNTASPKRARRLTLKCSFLCQQINFYRKHVRTLRWPNSFPQPKHASWFQTSFQPR